MLYLITNKFDDSVSVTEHLCISSGSLCGGLNPSEGGEDEDKNLFPFLKLFSPMKVMLASKTWKEFIWVRMCIIPFFFFPWVKLHWMLQNWINVALSTICFLWLKIVYLLIHKSGKNRKAMQYGSACRSILNDNHFLIQLRPYTLAADLREWAYCLVPRSYTCRNLGKLFYS